MGQITYGDSFHNDRHPDLRADYILANPPFNVSDWGGEQLRDDKRWQYGVPPARNANFAWVQHMVYHLAPRGVAGFVLANGSMSSNQSGEGEIRKNLVEADLVDCMVALPGQLFYSTQIPACLWVSSPATSAGTPWSAASPTRLSMSGAGETANEFRGRKGEILFIDARKLGRLVDRTHRELDRRRHRPHRRHLPCVARRGEREVSTPTFRASARAQPSNEVRKHGHVLTPGRYVGAEPQPEDSEPFEEKMKRLTAQWREQQPKRGGWMTRSRRTWRGWGLNQRQTIGNRR